MKVKIPTCLWEKGEGQTISYRLGLCAAHLEAAIGEKDYIQRRLEVWAYLDWLHTGFLKSIKGLKTK